MVDEAPSFSALPHDVMRDTSLSRDARLLYAILQGHWWQGGECWLSHAKLAAEMGCGVRQLQRYLKELVDAKIITERYRGHGQQKAYGPDLTRQQSRVEGDKSDALDVSNTTSLSSQHDTGVASNTTPVSDRRRSIDKDSSGRKKKPPLRGVVAADATPAPKGSKPKAAKKQVRSRKPSPDETEAPDTIELTEQSYETAAKWGFSRESVDFELELFLTKARSKKTKFVDWKQGFKTWLLNEFGYAKRDKRPVGHLPPGCEIAPRPGTVASTRKSTRY